MAKQDKIEYRLLDDRSGISFLLKVGRDNNLVVYDEANKHNRAIRHCPNEKSIYLDEQSDLAVVEPIDFRHGYLQLKPTEVSTINFLNAHPDNASNGGHLFELVDLEKEADDFLEYEEKLHKIKTVIWDKKADKDGDLYLSMVASVILGSVEEAEKLSRLELTRVLLEQADDDPDFFLNETGDVTIFEDGETQRKYIALKAIRDGVIKKSTNGRSIQWGKGNKKIIDAPTGIDVVEYFIEFLGTDEGILVADEISKRIA